MDPDRSPRVHVSNPTGRSVATAKLRAGVLATLRLHGCVRGDVSVLLADDAGVRELNRNHRGIDESTDVLSFPAAEMPHAPLGDVVISVPYAERQAASRGVPIDVEIAYLAIHGTLHLLGMDDASDAERDAMMAAMHRAGLEAGLPEERGWSSVLQGGGA